MLNTLEPQLLWKHFLAICSIPHVSKHEQALRDYIKEWANKQNWKTEVDTIGNLLIRKPASPGCEHRPGIILQAHLDMVAQQNKESKHDFLHDPIEWIIEAGWVHARSTTLGADNGIGVAAALAALEDNSLRHGSLEVLLTLNEEAGMTGARGLQPGWLTGKLLLNLDTETWGEIYIGCAGGTEVIATRDYNTSPLDDTWHLLTLSILGLKGGHSGCDIHLERGHAIPILGIMLNGLGDIPVRLIHVQGGSLRNAISREAISLLAIPADCIQKAQTRLHDTRKTLKAAYSSKEPDFEITITQGHNLKAHNVVDHSGLDALSHTDTKTIIHLLCTLPCGVVEWNIDFPHVVETSNNLGPATLHQGHFELIMLVRSLSQSNMDQHVQYLVSLLQKRDLYTHIGNTYPVWKPNQNSKALHLVQSVYLATFGASPQLSVIHAGLECGLIGATYPHLEMVSFGPLIRHAHSPDERVEIQSTQQFWTLLREVVSHP